MLETFKVALPVLLSLTVCGGVVIPTPSAPKLRLTAERLITGPNPVPDKLTICGLNPPLSLMFKAEATLPIVLGLKLMLMVQFAPGATIPLVMPAGMQVFVCVNGLAKVVIAVIVSGLVPSLFKVTVAGTLLVPTACFPNAMLVGDKVTAVLVPVRLTV